MAKMAITHTIKKPAADWATDNTVLLKSTKGLESDTGKYKIGDGIRVWLDIPYYAAGTFVSPTVIADDLEGDLVGDVTGDIDAETINAETINAETIAVSLQSSCRVSTTNAQAILASTSTIVEFDDVAFDNQNEYDNTTNFRFTAAEVGTYAVFACVQFDSAAFTTGNQFSCHLFKNGSLDAALSFEEIEANSTRPALLSGAVTIKLAANDYIDIRVFQVSSATRSLNNKAYENYLSIQKLS